MVKKLIIYLYNRYCKSEIKTLYLGGIQRDFSKNLTESARVQRQAAIYAFLQTEHFEQIINESLKEYSKVLFSVCEKDKQRDIIHNNINVLLNFEKKFKEAGIQPAIPQDFDKFSTI